MKRILLLGLFIVSMFLVSCVSDMPPEPPAPGQSSGQAVAGQAIMFNTELLQAGYAQPVTFTLSKDVVAAVQEPVAVSVQGEYIYKVGYYAKDGQWVSFDYDGSTIGTSKWMRTTASKDLAVMKDTFPKGTNYVLAYTCKRAAGVWDCNGNKWMIQQFEFNPPCASDTDCATNQICDIGACIELPSAPGTPSAVQQTITPQTAESIVTTTTPTTDITKTATTTTTSTTTESSNLTKVAVVAKY